MWVKKLLLAKSRTFDGGDDCQGVPLTDMINLQKELDASKNPLALSEASGTAAYIEIDGYFDNNNKPAILLDGS